MSQSESVTIGTFNLRTGQIPGDIYDAGLIPVDLSPDFQRTFEAWDGKLKTRLIETILNGHTMNPIWLIKIPSPVHANKYIQEVLDGQHRLKTIMAFIRNEFPLNGNYFVDQEVGVRHNGKQFKDLDIDIQDSIRSYKMQVNILPEKFREPDRLKQQYEILNRSSKPLNNYEFNKVILHPIYSILDEFKAQFIETFMFNKINDKRGKLHSEMLTIIVLSLEMPKTWTSLTNIADKWLERVVGTSDKVTTYLTTETGNLESRLASFGSVLKKMEACGFDVHYDKNATFLKLLASGLVNNCPLTSDKGKMTRVVNLIKPQVLAYFDLDDDAKLIKLNISVTTNPAGKQLGIYAYITDMLKPLFSEIQVRSFSEKIKTDRLLEQNGMCAICEKPFIANSKTEADHRKPWSEGGSSTIDNCDILHPDCHRLKHNQCS